MRERNRRTPDDKSNNRKPQRRSPYKTKIPNKTTTRLNKYIAHSGLCSRREADEFIRTGLVKVNDKVVTEMGFQVGNTDKVWFDGRLIQSEKPTYILLNKPKGFITTTKDEKARKTVMDLIAKATTSRVYPVGRLDRPTTGVLLLTNDGNMSNKLTHPANGAKKIYHVTLDKPLSQEDLDTIKKGIHLFEGVAKVDQISHIQGKNKNEVGITLHIGWNRIIRRIFEKLNYEVIRLDRVSFAGLTKKTLKRGDWRHLSKKEVDFLKMR